MLKELNENKDASFLVLNIALILIFLLFTIVLAVVMCWKEYKNLNILLS